MVLVDELEEVYWLWKLVVGECIPMPVYPFGTSGCHIIPNLIIYFGFKALYLHGLFVRGNLCLGCTLVWITWGW